LSQLHLEVLRALDEKDLDIECYLACTESNIAGIKKRPTVLAQLDAIDSNAI
jgi:hypothetical protein